MKPTALAAAAPHAFLGQENLVIPTLNHGNCVGYAIPPKETETLPDGRVIRYENPSPTSSSEKHRLVIAGKGRNTTIDLGATGGCVSISPDWKRMLVLDDWSGSDRPAALTIYDFEKSLTQGALEPADVAPAPVSSPMSAFFVGSTGDLVTTDLSNKVMRWRFEQGHWRSWEVFHGDNDIGYAEPDETGDRLVIIEHHVGDNETGILYSVKARQIWYDLGSDYKWLGVTFNAPANVAVSAHWKWTGSFPLLPLSKLKSLAEANLSAHCRPKDPNDYRSSPCWPAILD